MLPFELYRLHNSYSVTEVNPKLYGRFITMVFNYSSRFLFRLWLQILVLLDDYLVCAPVSVLNGEVHNLKNRQYYLLQKSSFQIRVQTTFSVFCQLLHFFGWFSRWSKKKVVSWSEFESPNQCFLSRVMSLSSNCLSILFRSSYESVWIFLSMLFKSCYELLHKSNYKKILEKSTHHVMYVQYRIYT